MAEEVVSKAIDEIKKANEDDLKKVIEQHFEMVRTQGMKIGATYIAAAVFGAIDKNLTNGKNSSLRDYQRAIKRVMEIVSVQLAQDKDSEEETNDGTAE
jgi:hypothetical protein